MSDVCHIDFETRSVVDLTAAGAYVYFDDPTTDLWCAAYAFGDEEPADWFPGEPCPPRIADHVVNGGLIFAFNAAFERLAWRQILGPRYGWPVPNLRQYRCVMALAYAHALPGKLEHVAPALGLKEEKDMVGSRIMRKMMRPRSPRKNEPPGLYWHDKPGDLEKLSAYCRQDTRTERAVHARLLPLSDIEQETWFLDQQINDRGVYIDEKLCLAAQKIVSDTEKKLSTEMRRITDGEVRGVSNVTELIAFVRKYGVDTDSIAKDELADILIRDDLDPVVRRALEIRQEGSKTSTAKIKKMLLRRQADGYSRGNIQYHGAATGRFSARGIQMHNLVRPSDEDMDVDSIVNDVLMGDAELIELLHGSPMTVISDCVRSMLVAAPDA